MNPADHLLLSVTIAVLLAPAAWSASAPSGSGLSVAIYANPTLSEPALIQSIDPVLDHDWGGGPPTPGAPADDFSVRWQGRIRADWSEPYTVYATSDDGIRVWIDGALVIDAWSDHPPQTSTGEFTAVAGHLHAIRVEHYEHGGGAVARLEWSSAHVARAVVPTADLYPLDRWEGEVPATSLVSPLFIEGERLPGVAISAQGSAAGAVHDLGAAAFYADVPLKPNGTTPVRVAGAGREIKRNVRWTAIDLAGRTSYSDVYRIREHDRLLLAFPASAETVRAEGDAGEVVVRPAPHGHAVEVPFDAAGTATITALDDDGRPVGSITVIVVGIGIGAPAPVALHYGLDVDVGVTPASEAATTAFGPLEDAALRAAPGITGDGWRRVRIDAGRRGPTGIVARLPSGPIIGVVPVAAYQIESDDNLDLQFGVDGHGVGEVIVRPFTPGAVLRFAMFAHRTTFLGGAWSFSVPTDGGDSSLGEPGFELRRTADGETFGRFRFTLLKPDDEDRFCFSIEPFKADNAYQGD